LTPKLRFNRFCGLEKLSAVLFFVSILLLVLAVFVQGHLFKTEEILLSLRLASLNFRASFLDLDLFLRALLCFTCSFKAQNPKDLICWLIKIFGHAQLSIID
jgi:hypothetical protein